MNNLKRIIAEELALQNSLLKHRESIDNILKLGFLTFAEIQKYADNKKVPIKAGDIVTVKSDYAMVKKEHQVYTTGEVIGISGKYIKLKIENPKNMQWLQGEFYIGKFPISAIHEVNGKIIQANEVLEKILKTMKDVNDVEKYIGIRWKRKDSKLIAEIFDSRLGLDAPTILPVNIYNTQASVIKMKKEAIGVFKDWLKGIREKVNKN